MTDKSILIVDDEAIVLISLKTSLQCHFENRFSYETALDGEEALMIVVAIKIRYPNVASIMITGHANDEAKKRVLSEAGTIRIFDKPWKTIELIQTIESVCYSIK